MKVLIDNDQLKRLRIQAKKVDKLMINTAGLDLKIVAQVGFLIGMINATKYTAKKYEQ